MIVFELVTGKLPARWKAEGTGFAKRVPALARSFAAVRWRLPRGAKLPAKAIIQIHLITDHNMKKLNKKFRHKDSATDVLSFSYPESGMPVFPHEPVGEVYISYMTAARQAKENSLSLKDELSVLLVHGALHVMGYDHETSERDRAAMHKLEAKVLSASGIRVPLTGR